MHVKAKAVGERLRVLILERGWNQSELARKSGMRPSNVSNYLRGSNVPNPRQLAKLAEALGTTPADILNFGGEASPAPGSRAVSLTPVDQREGHMRLQVDQVVPAELATQVIGLLLARLTQEQSPATAPGVHMAGEPEAEVAIKRAPIRPCGSILDTLLPANPPKPLNAKQIRPLDGPCPVAVEDLGKLRKVG